MRPKTLELRTLPVPEHYRSASSRLWSYRPNELATFERAVAWRAEHELTLSGPGERHVALLIVDAQKDFCFPEGSLYVGGRSGAGAMDDNERLARFIYRHLPTISEITCTLDTHLPFQIFFPAFWQDRNGGPVGANREITTDDIRTGEVAPSEAVAAWLCEGDTAWLHRQVEFYCQELERAGKYRLFLWPPHCLVGSEGHALAGVIQEARLFHAYARGAQNSVEIKGEHALTENYSVLSPEVLHRHDGRTLAERNLALIDSLLRTDVLIVAGQAASHCVKSTLDDLLSEIEARDATLAERVFVLRDCMSAVAVPDPARAGGFLFDFTPQAEEALRVYERAGMHVVESTVAMEEWPGIRG